ncbi:MAG: bifunctional folylpolyglutamate synthase/dihydrofolate synthase [Synergistaceae bacterium]|nr:bifunctional folylpolyglutamate synthase/dihydrofolate synthase [Synergistaceae bacterium]MBR2207582.1 bifunctional folylpolyglutamate synthase/dihydrofolate synthase [Synergistaceae bacterium]
MNTYDEFEKILYTHSNNKIIPGLERIKRLLTRLDNPQNSFKSIHIVGTNGKGSTGAFLSSIFKESGYKTGFYLSPHLVSPGERFVIDGEILPADDWINAAEEIIKVIKPDEELPSYFELVTACAFWLAREKKIEVGVIEAGLGGKFDATNVMSETVCSVITSISMDHMEFLGSLLENIAEEKFAVVKNKTHACFSGVDASLIPMFKNYCSERGALSHVLTEEAKIENILISPDGNSFDFSAQNLEIKNLKTKLIGDYQINNAALSLLAISEIKDLFPKITEQTVRDGLEKATWPGRLEIISREPLIILDGGHNYDGVKKLCESVKNLWPDIVKNKKLGVVYAAMRDKNYLGCLELISKELKPAFYATTVPGMSRALAPDELLNAAKNEEFEWLNKFDIIQKINPESFENPLNAIKKALSENEAVLICGSLYLVGWLKRNADKF